MKAMVIFLPPDTARRIKVLAAENDRTVQDIGEEAVTQWLERHDTSDLSPKKLTGISTRNKKPEKFDTSNPEKEPAFPLRQTNNG